MTENFDRYTKKAKELSPEVAEWFLDRAVELAKELVRVGAEREQIREHANNRLKNETIPPGMSFGRACGIMQGLVHKNFSIEKRIDNKNKKKESIKEDIEITENGLVLDTKNNITVNPEIESNYTKEQYQDLLEAREEYRRMKEEEMIEGAQKLQDEEEERSGNFKVQEDIGYKSL